ncbi:MAG: hypothetical protein QOI26_1736 [Pseudonocardiales bacterium]|nr:hypothetical protein [Pseudonocardiales bacterium]
MADAGSALLTVRRGGCDNMTTADALGPLIDAVPELTAVIEDEAEVNRLRLFRPLRAELTAVPTLLLLEDVHWADEATLEILRFLGRRIDSMPLLVLATFREDEVVGSHPLTVVLGRPGNHSRRPAHYLRYWVDQERGKIFCLVDAPARRRPPRCTARRTAW